MHTFEAGKNIKKDVMPVIPLIAGVDKHDKHKSKIKTLPQYRLENELLKAEKTVSDIAMGEMSREICELNGQLQDILSELRQLREMQ